MRAVAAHHGEFPTDSTVRFSVDKWDRSLVGVGPAWGSARSAIVEALRAHFQVEHVPTADVDHGYVVLLAGLTSVADWIGSMTEFFPYAPPQLSLDIYWERARKQADHALAEVGMRQAPVRLKRTFAELFPYQPWPLHAAVDVIAAQIDGPAMVVIEAPMGEGKTEAALTLANAVEAVGGCGVYVGLPTQATANQMFNRVKAFLERTRPDEAQTLILAHGEASLVDQYEAIKLRGIYGSGGERSASVGAEAWFQSKKRGLIAENAVGTIDQALLSVLRLPHGFVRSFGLASKAVILDEVHAYDTYTGTLLDELCEWLGAMGTSVILLSATLPRARREELVRRYQSGARHPAPDETVNLISTPAYPRITVADSRGLEVTTFAPRGEDVRVALSMGNSELEVAVHSVLDAVRDGGCAGWIVNTVQRAQDAFVALRAHDPALEVLLVHARLLPRDRLDRERKLAEWLGPKGERPARCVVVGTQVLEQSLDVDFDVLFTDIAPVDLVLQRAGRLWRHQRTDRSPSQVAPRVFVLRPEAGAEAAALESLTIMYARVFIELTLRELDRRGHLNIPGDIEPLVARVYDATIIEGSAVTIPPDLVDAAVEHLGSVHAERSTAEQRMIPRPTIRDHFLGDLQVFLSDDDDPALHPHLRAVTRLGDPSVDVVCLTREGGVLRVGDHDGSPLDLEAAPDRSLIRRLVERSIGVSRPGVVKALLAIEPPEGWKTSAILRYRRPVIFEDGQAEVGGTSLRLDPDLGLVFSKST